MPQFMPIQPSWLLFLCGVVALVAFILFWLQTQPTYEITTQPITPASWTWQGAASTGFPPLLSFTSQTYENPSLLRIEPPQCYSSTSQTKQCLGRIYNDSAQPMSNIHLQILTTTTTPLAIEQRWIPSGASAPYRLFWQQEEQPRLILSGFESKTRSFYPLTWREDHAEWHTVGGDTAHIYRILGRISNPYSHSVQHIQLIATLVDRSEQRLLGYRILPLPEGIQVGGDLPIEMEIVPLVVESGIIHRVMLYGWND